MEDAENNRNEAIREIQSYAFDLESKLDEILLARQNYYSRYQELNLNIGTDHAYLDLNILINEMSTSFVTPAYHYNMYIKNLVNDLIWDDVKYQTEESEWESNVLRRVKYQADAQSVFLSIKTCLDRLVSIFTYYFRGVSSNSTFGRYKESGKPSGLMSKVHEFKDSDELMRYIESEYHKWIKFAVSPRDVITHYNDLQILYYFDSKTGFELPIHGGSKLLNSDATSTSYGFVSLKEFVDQWYQFFSVVMQELLKRDLITERTRI